jgi:hypothetical protein
LCFLRVVVLFFVRDIVRNASVRKVQVKNPKPVWTGIESMLNGSVQYEGSICFTRFLSALLTGDSDLRLRFRLELLWVNKWFFPA